MKNLQRFSTGEEVKKNEEMKNPLRFFKDKKRKALLMFFTRE